ncbi:hypothetical protein J3R83DRAFT_12976 [Lanmaoa asiatica]|nr:hypothetical protein J3R83DRAFT_12976 [Lanmaoa asiatica]
MISTRLITLLALAASLPLTQSAMLDVWAPQITDPRSDTVWYIGTFATVSWDVSNPPSSITNPQGTIYLVKDGVIDLQNPLVENFDILAGTVAFIVPDVPSGIYQIDLFGDSGDLALMHYGPSTTASCRRPTQSTTPQHGNGQQSKTQFAKRARPKAVDFLSESEGAEPPHSTIVRLHEVHDGGSDDEGPNVDSDKDEDDIDAPRVAQWIDDDDLELQEHMDDVSPSLDSESEGVDDDDHGASEAEPSRRLRSLEDDLSTLPLGTLRSAQRSLAQAQALSDTESDSEEQSKGGFSASEDDSFPHPKEKPDQPSKPRNDLTKRTNKHAPVEVTSKRPVSRRRMVVDDKLPKPRDPRFMHAAGRYDPSKFKQQYDFLSGLRNNELLTLREHMKRARKLLANSPSHLRAEREEEGKRLERAMKKAESAVNLDNREHVEFKALRSAKQTEKEKRKQGKARWWMKRCKPIIQLPPSWHSHLSSTLTAEQKELLAKARLDAIASVGGKQAMKKAVEKKQKKISQKEKKTRPFPRSEAIEWSNGKRRRPVGSVDSGRVKRRKVA